MKRIYVFDTNVFLTDWRSIYRYKNHDIVVPLKVLDEIDKHKKRQDGVGVNARSTIRVLDSLRKKGNLHKGVRIKKGSGLLFVRGYNPELMPPGFYTADADNQIICTALTEKKKAGKRKLVLISRDINMRVKCDSLGIEAEDFVTEQVVQRRSDLFTGFKKHLVDDQIIDRFYEGETVQLEKEEGKFFPNQFIMLVSSSNEKKTALAFFRNYNIPLTKINPKEEAVWGLRPKNKEQSFALELLLNDEVPIVTSIGKAGCGKTLLAIAAGLDLVMEKKIYNKLVISRPIQPLGKDLGYLPGTIAEKMAPWLMPVRDNLEFLLNGGTRTNGSKSSKFNVDFLFENGTIEVEALSYIRGRSISNAFIIIDEAQNLTTHELKTIITRVGENTKIVLTGDIEQIDNVYLDSVSNGLSYAIEKFKEHDLAGHITLQKGERSKVATLASKIL
jgi:PhoH-like ATPase